MASRATRRELLLLAAAGAAGALLAACGRSGDDAGRGAPPTSSGSSSAPPASPGDTVPAEAGPGLPAFAAELYRTVVAASGGNVALSPYSVVSALAMVRNGARSSTAAEMDAVLRSTDLAQLNQRFVGLERALASRAGPHEDPGGGMVEVELATANRLFGDRASHFEADFLRRLADAYGAPLEQVDYRRDPDAARDRINTWVKERTHERIPELVPRGVLDTSTRLVLTNAIYLNAPWELPFSPLMTADRTFRTLDDRTVTTPTMSLLHALRYGRGDGWQAVGLPYVGGQLAMVVLVPDAGRFPTVEATLGPELLDEVAASLQPTDVQLRLPRWRFRFHVSLEAALSAMGMPTAFDPERADFSGMTAEERFVISAVLHEVFIAVDEKGTEAAAATAAAMGAVAAPAEPVVLDVDRPFLFLLRDVPTGAPLFIGRVVDPTA